MDGSLTTSRLCLGLMVGVVVLAGCGAASGTRTVTVGSTTASAPVRPPRATAVSSSFPTLVAKDQTGVIRIEASTCDGRSVGTGFLIGDRYVATVEHVVNLASSIVLKQNGRQVGIGTVIGSDSSRDVALVQASRPIRGNLFTLTSKAPQLGDAVAAMGFPLGLPLTVTRGSVSGTKRDIPIDSITRRQLVQTDAAVNPGNSGGPLLSTNTGQVVGLIDLGTNLANGVAFAVSAQVAQPLFKAWQAAPQQAGAPSCSMGNTTDTSSAPLTPPSNRPAPSPGPPSSGGTAQAVSDALQQHFQMIQNGDYTGAWNDLTGDAASKAGSQADWIKGQTQDGLQSFALDVSPQLSSSNTAVANINTFNTQSQTNGCKNWSGSWGMTLESNGQWKISSVNLSSTGC
jgi:serine protease Do